MLDCEQRTLGYPLQPLYLIRAAPQAARAQAHGFVAAVSGEGHADLSFSALGSSRLSTHASDSSEVELHAGQISSEFTTLSHSPRARGTSRLRSWLILHQPIDKRHAGDFLEYLFEQRPRRALSPKHVG